LVISNYYLFGWSRSRLTLADSIVGDFFNTSTFMLATFAKALVVVSFFFYEFFLAGMFHRFLLSSE